jgi:hypothetical protein
MALRFFTSSLLKPNVFIDDFDREVVAGLGARSPPVNQTANHKAADTAEEENRNVLVRNDGVGKADEQAKQKAGQPARPAWQLHTTDNESNSETAGEGTEQSRRLVWERHGQHEQNIQSAEEEARNETENHFGHDR